MTAYFGLCHNPHCSLQCCVLSHVIAGPAGTRRSPTRDNESEWTGPGRDSGNSELYRSSRNGTSPKGTRDSGRTGFFPVGTDRPARRRPAALDRPGPSLPPLVGPTRSAGRVRVQTRTQTPDLLIVHALFLAEKKHAVLPVPVHFLFSGEEAVENPKSMMIPFGIILQFPNILPYD